MICIFEVKDRKNVNSLNILYGSSTINIYQGINNHYAIRNNLFFMMLPIFNQLLQHGTIQTTYTHLCMMECIMA